MSANVGMEKKLVLRLIERYGICTLHRKFFAWESENITSAREEATSAFSLPRYNVMTNDRIFTKGALQKLNGEMIDIIHVLLFVSQPFRRTCSAYE